MFVILREKLHSGYLFQFEEEALCIKMGSFIALKRVKSLLGQSVFLELEVSQREI